MDLLDANMNTVQWRYTNQTNVKQLLVLALVINDSLEIKPTLFEIYDRAVSATGTVCCSPQPQRQMRIFTLSDWPINHTTNIIFNRKSLELACAG